MSINWKRMFVKEQCAKWYRRGVQIETCEACGLVVKVSRKSLKFGSVFRCHCMDDKHEPRR